MNFTSGRLSLIQDESESAYEYLIELALRYEYRLLNDPDRIRHEIRKFVKNIWIGYGDGQRGGCAFLSYIKDYGIYTFDAYKDNAVSKAIDNKIPWAYEAGKLLIPYILENITPEIWSWHDVRNRAATVVLKRLGFTDLMDRDLPFGKVKVFKIGGSYGSRDSDHNRRDGNSRSDGRDSDVLERSAGETAEKCAG